MTIKLDIKDRKILSELDMDARQPLSKIAKKVKLSREVVGYRIKQLEKRGIIEGYYTALDTTKLGLMYCRIYLKYRQMTQEKEKELLNYCKKSPVIIWVTFGEGRWDITIICLVEDLSAVEALYDDLSMKFGRYFQNPYLTPAFRIHHYKHNYLYKTKDFKEAILGGRSKKIKLDKIDNKILGILSDNARASLLEISKKLSITPKSINHRIKKLIKEKIIISFRTKINTKLLGYDHWKVFLTLQNLTKDKENKLYTFLRHHPSVIYITKPMGMHNLEFEIMVTSSNELHEFTRNLRLEFAEIIVDYDTMLNYAEPLLSYF